MNEFAQRAERHGINIRDSIDGEPLYVRQSELRKHARCKRSWLYQYEMGMVRKERSEGPSSAALGTLVHTGLQAYYEAPGTESERQREKLSELIEEYGDPQSDDWDKYFELSNIMLEGYIDWVAYEGVDMEYDVLGVEVPVQEKFTENAVVTGTIDLVLRNRDTAKITLIDFKTVSSFSQAPLPADNQMAAYAVLYRDTFGEAPERVGHRMLRKVKRTARAKPPFYMEWLIPAGERFADLAHVKVSQGLDDVLRSRGVGADPVKLYPTATKDCSWDCGYVDLCSSVELGSEGAEEAFEIRGRSWPYQY